MTFKEKINKQKKKYKTSAERHAFLMGIDFYMDIIAERRENENYAQEL